MIIRRCTEDDIERVYEIEKLSFPHPYPKIFFYHYLGDFFFVIEKQGEIAGYIIADVKRNLIVSVAVHPSYRKQGYGKMLMKHAISYMKGEIILQVRKSNRGAIYFYEKMGFRRKGELKSYYMDGEDAIIMVMKKD